MLDYENKACWMDAQENIAVYIKGKKAKKKILKVANKYPGMIAHNEREGRMLAIIPKKCIKLRPTKKIKQMADRDKRHMQILHR